MYTTLETFQQRYGEREALQLTDRDRSGVVDTAVFEAACLSAKGIIDGYLAQRFQMPPDEASAGGLLRDISLTITRYKLHEDNAPERVRVAYEDALKMLREASKGNIGLGLADAAAGSSGPQTSGGPQFEAPDRVFTRTNMAGY